MAPFLLITDLDNTLVGDDLAMTALNRQIKCHREQNGTQLVYSTGRSLTRYKQLRKEKPLLEPDVLICAVGTEIYHAGSDIPDAQWSTHLSHSWNRELGVAIAAHFSDLTLQPDSEQRRFKISYYLTERAAVEVLPELESLLDDRGLDAQVIYSGSQDLDILPSQADKGKAMTFVRQLLGISATQTIACGDSGNDIALFADRQERGIIVGNAKTELLQWHYAHPNPDRYFAKASYAGGILEGLQYFGFL